MQERLKAAEAKRIEKERTEKYNKLKTDAKDARAKYREKYSLPESPPRSDAEEESESEDEEDGFGPAKKVEQDPMDREYLKTENTYTEKKLFVHVTALLIICLPIHLSICHLIN